MLVADLSLYFNYLNTREKPVNFSAKITKRLNCHATKMVHCQQESTESPNNILLSYLPFEVDAGNKPEWN